MPDLAGPAVPDESPEDSDAGVRTRGAAEYGLILGGAALALPLEFCCGFPFYFSPGWANHWPSGLSIHLVWSTFATFYLFALLMTFGTGVGAFFGLVSLGLGFNQERTRSAFRIWFVLWCCVVGATCILAWFAFHAETHRMWPGGYPPAP